CRRRKCRFGAWSDIGTCRRRDRPGPRRRGAGRAVQATSVEPPAGFGVSGLPPLSASELEAAPESAPSDLPLPLPLFLPFDLKSVSYQPVPLRRKPAAEIFFFRLASPQDGQKTSRSSEIFCSASSSCPQSALVHWYS